MNKKEFREQCIKRIKLVLKNTNECIEMLPVDKDGYVVFQTNYEKRKITIRGHVLSYELYHEKEVPKGMYICHHCDNSSCINPKHLFLGTAEDNNRDRHSKGRTKLPGLKGKDSGMYKHGKYSKYDPDPNYTKGEIYGRKVDLDTVSKIKEAIKIKELSLKKIAEVFDVKYNTIRDISAGRAYSKI